MRIHPEVLKLALGVGTVSHELVLLDRKTLPQNILKVPVKYQEVL